MQSAHAWTTELQCYRCGKRVMPRLEPETVTTKVVFIDAGDRRRHLCCKGCIRPGDRVV